MAKTYQANNFTGEQLDDFMGKYVQRTLVGTGMSIDSEGVLHSNTRECTKLLYSYTHTRNIEVHPTAVDLTTGVWTSEGHGLAQDNVVFISVHLPYNVRSPYQYLPGGLLLGSVGGTSTNYYVNIVDDNHFTLSTTQGGEALTYTEVATMDLSKFHMEKIVRVGSYNDFVITDLPKSRDLLLVLNGRINYRYRYFFLRSGTAEASRWEPALGSPNGWCSYQIYLEYHMLEDRHVVQSHKIDAIVFSDANVATVTNVTERSTQHYIMPDDYIDGFRFHNGGGFYNGTTLEVYGK